MTSDGTVGLRYLYDLKFTSYGTFEGGLPPMFPDKAIEENRDYF